MIFRRLAPMRDLALLRFAALAAGSLVSGTAMAEGAGEGHAVPGQMGLQRGTTPPQRAPASTADDDDFED